MEKVCQLWSVPANSVAVLSTPDRSQPLNRSQTLLAVLRRQLLLALRANPPASSPFSSARPSQTPRHRSRQRTCVPHDSLCGQGPHCQRWDSRGSYRPGYRENECGCGERVNSRPLFKFCQILISSLERGRG